jgi:Leucine-rich repeat (LRR) protein
MHPPQCCWPTRCAQTPRSRRVVISLSDIRLWNDATPATELMGALTAHPRLRVLELGSWPREGGLQAAEVGALLATLLLANAPALQTLDIRRNHLGDEGMRPVVEALRHNTHLTKLNCTNNDLSEAFARERLLPAVRANAGLHELAAAADQDDEGAAREAEALVAARARTQPE